MISSLNTWTVRYGTQSLWFGLWWLHELFSRVLQHDRVYQYRPARRAYHVHGFYVGQRRQLVVSRQPAVLVNFSLCLLLGG
jgi:hypothetical protein